MTITPAASKYELAAPAGKIEGIMSASTEYRTAALAPSITRLFMPGPRCRISAHP